MESLVKKYQVIYADPPLQYSSTMLGGSSPDKHYKTMNFNDLLKLKISNISSDDCALFIWSPPSYIDGVMKIIKTWGFKYKTIAFVWIKLKKNKEISAIPGYWTMPQTEFVLFATKGKMLKYLEKRNIKQIVMSIKTRHSEKPIEVIERISEMFGNLKKIELFARKKYKGWDSFGDEITSDLQHGIID